MFFTQEDYKKIYEWISRNSIRDTEFNEALTPLDETDTITLIQNGANVRVSLKDLIDQLFSMGVSDFLNITDKFGEKNITLAQAIELIPYKSRKVGQVITFLDKNNKWKVYQFRGELTQWEQLNLWEDILDIESHTINSILPDEEDLTKTLPDDKGNSYLYLKDRAYNPEDFSGLGRIILRKNIVEVEDPIYGKVKKNILYQDMFTQSNTIYEIRYDFDLNGKEINIPEGCVLDFQGGSLSNGCINSVDCRVIYKTSTFYNIKIEDGVKCVNNIVPTSIYKDWDSEKSLQSCINLSNSGKVVFDGDFQYTQSESIVCQNKNIHIDGLGKTIRFINPQNRCGVKNFITVSDAHSFVLENLKMDGDSKNQLSEGASEFHFIYSKNVKYNKIYNCEFIDIDNAKIEDFHTNPHSYFIWFDRYTKCVFENNRIDGVISEEGIGFTPRELEKLIPNTPVNDYLIKFTDIENYVDKYNKTFNFVEFVNNSLKFKYVSSAMVLWFGRCDVKNNIFYTTRGSVLNVFCYNSSIIHNDFKGSIRSVIVDLTEYNTFNFLPINVDVSFNKCGANSGFVDANKVVNLTITNNVVDARNIDSELEVQWGQIPEFDFNAVSIIGILDYGKNITIDNNVISNYERGLLVGGLKKLHNVHISNNEIYNGENITSQNIIITEEVDNLHIVGNKFVNTGRSGRRWDNVEKDFINLLKTSKDASYKNIYIEENQFYLDNYNLPVSVCDIGCYSETDYNYPIVENVHIKNNICKNKVRFVINASGYNDLDRIGSERVVVKDNDWELYGMFTNIQVECDKSVMENKDYISANGRYNVYESGCYIPKKINILQRLRSNDNPQLVEVVKNTIYCTNATILKRGYYLIHNKYIYYVMDNGIYNEDFEDSDYIEQYKLFRIGSNYSYLDPKIFKPYKWRVSTIERETNAMSSFKEDYIGDCIFDYLLNKPCWYTGEKWVDATGADV